MQGEKDLSNDQAGWGKFDPEAYLAKNYLKARGDDLTMLRIAVEWFTESGAQDCRGFDAGTGPNLYPALAMLPFSREITLFERASESVAYLRRQLAEGMDGTWKPFWEVVRRHAPNAGDFAWAQQRLSEITRVVEGSILADPPVGEFNLGTMFFVAESYSTKPWEFRLGNKYFLETLEPGSPFCAAYMKDSKGYRVNEIWFPATPVGVKEVGDCLEPRATDLMVRHIYPDPAPLRVGQGGYVLATGKVAGTVS